MVRESLNTSEFLFEYLNSDSGFYLRKGSLLDEGESEFQKYEVWDSPQFGRLFRLDGYFMTSEKDEFFYHENLIHISAIAHPSPKKALVIGGGDGGSSEELLKYPSMEKVVLVELDGKVIDIAKEHLQTVHKGIFNDSRLEVRIEDGMKYVREEGPLSGEKFDLIILDLTDPIGPAAELYSPAFFRDCRNLLSEFGAMALHIGPPVFAPDRVQGLMKNLKEVFPLVRPYFLYIPLYGSLWGMACASVQLDPMNLKKDKVNEILAEREISDLQYYNGSTHEAVFALPNFIKKLV